MNHSLTAIIYDKKGNILSIGKNSYVRTHPLQAKFAKKMGLAKKIFIHAEIDAIVKCKDLSKAWRIVVMRFHKNGLPASAKPCPICEDAIKTLTAIKHVEHT